MYLIMSFLCSKIYFSAHFGKKKKSLLLAKAYETLHYTTCLALWPQFQPFIHFAPVTLTSFLFFKHTEHISISWFAWHALPLDFHKDSLTSFKLCANVTTSERHLLVTLSKMASLVTLSVFILLYFPLWLLFLILLYMYLSIYFPSFSTTA